MDENILLEYFLTTLESFGSLSSILRLSLHQRASKKNSVVKKISFKWNLVKILLHENF